MRFPITEWKKWWARRHRAPEWPMFGSFSHKTGESSSEHCIGGEHCGGRMCSPQLAVHKVCKGNMLSHKLVASGASAGYGWKLISLEVLEVQRSVNVQLQPERSNSLILYEQKQPYPLSLSHSRCYHLVVSCFSTAAQVLTMQKEYSTAGSGSLRSKGYIFWHVVAGWKKIFCGGVR